jgi:hypothetical protein
MRYVITGSESLAPYGAPRTTLDVDVVGQLAVEQAAGRWGGFERP